MLSFLTLCLSVSVYLSGPKTLGQPTEPKNGWNWLKFGTLVPWINTWGIFFHFFLNSLFWGPGDE